MNEAAVPQAARSMTAGEQGHEAVSRELEALRLARGAVCVFGHDDFGFWAARHHHPGARILLAETPDELGDLLTADFEADPS